MKNARKVFALFIAMVCICACGVTTFASNDVSEEALIRRMEEWANNLRLAPDYSTSSAPNTSSNTAFESATESIDLVAYAKESIALSNQQRLDAGLHELAIDEDMMKLAATRAKELAEKWGHERPDGTFVSNEYRYAEIISSRQTPEKVVNGWMASSKGHREILMAEKYQLIGAGCYQANNGTIYWVQLFSK